MLKNTRAIILSSLFATITAAPFAQAGTPRAGSNEFRIESSYLIPGLSVVGLTHESRSSSGLSSSSTLFGAGFAYGRFLTDNFEIGSALTVIRPGGSASGEVWSYGVSPFARAFAMATDRLAVFGGATAGVLRTDATNSSNSTQLSLGGEVGAEFFLGDSWSLRFGPTYRYLHQSTNTSLGSGTSSGNVYGVNWALAGYF